jgi:hypothetical protein
VLIPAFSRTPGRLAPRFATRFRAAVAVKARTTVSRTARTDWTCVACMKGKHGCVSKKCNCKRCDLAV